MLLGKIEDFRQASIKKFADRIEVSKNYKYLDLNLKQVLEQVMKKNDKGDNWLLAKKPFGGNSCASCENYIGDLKDNREYVPWNKFKDTSDKMYRLGTGFSKMLQDNVSDRNKGQNKEDLVNNILYTNMNTNQSHNFSTQHNFKQVQFGGNNSQTRQQMTSSVEIKKNINHNEELPKILNKIKDSNVSNNNNKLRGSTTSNMNIVLNTGNLSMEIPENEEVEEDNDAHSAHDAKVLKIYKVKNKIFDNPQEKII